MIMDCKGNLYSFGCPEYGQLGHNSDGKSSPGRSGSSTTASWCRASVAIFIEKTKDGQILPVPNVGGAGRGVRRQPTRWSWTRRRRVFLLGVRGLRAAGPREQKDEMVPRLVEALRLPGGVGRRRFYAGYTCSFAVSETGGLFFWGATNTSRESTMYPKAVQDLCGWKIRSLACGKSSIIVAADESTISWGPSPTFGELGYGDHKPKSSTAAQEVKTLDGIYTEQVAMGLRPLAGDRPRRERRRKGEAPQTAPSTTTAPSEGLPLSPQNRWDPASPPAPPQPRFSKPAAVLPTPPPLSKAPGRGQIYSSPPPPQRLFAFPTVEDLLAHPGLGFVCFGFFFGGGGIFF
ncbi:protein RCC2 [Pluvialis apricaria]